MNSITRRNLVAGVALLDVLVALLLFIPAFGNGAEAPSAVSLLTLSGVSPWVEAAFALVVGATVLCGLCEVATANLDKPILSRRLLLAGTVLSVICVTVFIATRQPYAGIVCFALLVTKSLMLSKHVQ